MTVRGTLRIGFVGVQRDAFKGDARAVTQRAAEALTRLGDGHGYTLVRAPASVDDAASAERMATWASAQDLDMLLVLHATFATGDLLAPLLRATGRVGVWAVPEREGLPLRRPGVHPDLAPLPLNSLCGLNMTLSLLEHRHVATGRPVKWFWGAPDSDAFRRRWATTLGALHGLRALEKARVLQIGGTAPAFYRLEERPDALSGVQVETLPLGDLYDRMAAVPNDDVAARTEAWQRREPLAGATVEHLRVAARTVLALDALAREGGFQALALRCWPEFADRCGGMACAAVGAMADRGIPTACEGDVMGALSMLALQGVAGAPSALMDLSDLDLARDRVLLWHCGNAPVAFAAQPGARLTTHFNRDGTGVVRDMRLAPGPASGFRLLDRGAAAVIISGRIDDTAEPDVDGVRGWWGALRWDGVPRSAMEVVSQILDRRLPHHLALAPGSHDDALHELSAWIGASVIGPERARDALLAPTA